MAISPNVDFTSGQILTATQQNQFPRGIVAFTQRTTDSTGLSSESIQITATTFTAVANRYYKITYFEPLLDTDGAGESIKMGVRLTNISGAVQQVASFQTTGGTAAANSQTLSIVKTFSAGSTVLVATLSGTPGTFNAYRNASNIAYICVEDLGPA
jgi:hypothetical protein